MEIKVLSHNFIGKAVYIIRISSKHNVKCPRGLNADPDKARNASEKMHKVDAVNADVRFVYAL